MQNKYIIKNCPCYNNENFIRDFFEPNDSYCTYYKKNCKECTSCLLKQIVEATKEVDYFIRKDRIMEIFDIENIEESEK